MEALKIILALTLSVVSLICLPILIVYIGFVAGVLLLVVIMINLGAFMEAFIRSKTNDLK